MKVSAPFRSSVVVVIVSLFVAVSAPASAGKKAGQTGTDLGYPQATDGSTPQVRKPTLHELYGMFLTYAAHVETRSNADERAGIDRSFYRHHLQQASGLTAEEYIHVLDIAREFLASDADIKRRITDWNKTMLGDQGNPPTPSILGSSAYKTELVRLFDLRQSTLDSEIERLRDLLGSDRSQVLEDYLEGPYSNPIIGAQPAHGISRVERGESSAYSNITRNPSQHESGIPQSQLSASPENVTIGYSPVCKNFSSSPGEPLSSMCVQATMSYLGPLSQVELWGACSWANVYGYDGYSCTWSMIENGTTMPASSFYNCSGQLASGGGTCDIDLSYGSNVRYNLPVALTLYFWDGCNGPCSATVSGTLASVFIGSTSISSLSQTQFYYGQSGTFQVQGLNLVSPFQNPPSVHDDMGCFSRLSAQSYSNQTVTVQFGISQNPEPPGSTLCSIDNLHVSNGFQAALAPISITPQPPSINGSDGNPIGSSPIQVVAGQQLTLSVTAPPDHTIQSQSWSFGNPGDVVGGFQAADGSFDSSRKSGGATAVTGTNLSTISFYFTVPSQTETVQVSTLYTDGSRANATGTFNVDGPTGVSVTNLYPVAPVNIWLNPEKHNTPWIELGNGPAGPQSTFGIVLQATAAHMPTNIGSNAGFQWVQLVEVSPFRPRESGVAQPTTCQSSTALPALDTQYPMFISEILEDAPGLQLPSNYGEIAGGNTLKAYLMWDPALGPAGCARAVSDSETGSCTSIPIPIGNLTWSWSGDAVNTLSTQASNHTTYIQNCGHEAGDATSFVLDGTFPNWSTVVPDGQNYPQAFTCSPPLN